MSKTELSTLCYLEQDGKYLMLHRVKKKNDINKEKWIGVGGHFEAEEAPEECVIREVREETGFTLNSWNFRGIVTFVSGDGVVEYMHLYTADETSGELIECSEGELVWIDKSEVYNLPVWEGDKIFFRLLEEREDYFSLKLIYNEAGELIESEII